MLFAVIALVHVSWQGVSRGYMHFCNVFLSECSFETIPFKQKMDINTQKISAF